MATKVMEGGASHLSAGAILADWGADAIKIEHPMHDRGKRSVGIACSMTPTILLDPASLIWALNGSGSKV